MRPPSPSRIMDARLSSRRSQRLHRAVELLRNGIPRGDLVKDDWEAIQIALRVVYETEQFISKTRRQKWRRRTEAVSQWSDSVEASLTFMSWVRELASIVRDVIHPAALPTGLPTLVRRHAVLAGRLLEPKLAPAERMSALLELGGIEVALLGHFWPLRVVHPSHVVRGVTAAMKQAREEARKGQGQLSEAQVHELLKTAEVRSGRARKRLQAPLHRRRR